MAVAVMRAPVRPDVEGDDRAPDLRSLIDHDHAMAAIERSKVIALRPAALAMPDHVAPVVAGDAAVDAQPGAFRNRVDGRVFRAGSGAQIEVRGGDGGGRHGGC